MNRSFYPPSNNRFAPACVLVSLLCVLYTFVVNVAAQEFKSAHDGVEYAELTREIAGQPVRMNLLRLDLRKVRLDVHHAFDKAIGVETTSAIASRHGGVAAINAGFFRLDKSEFAGEDVGLLMIDKFLLSEPSLYRTALAVTNGRKETKVSFDRWIFSGFLRWRSSDRPNILKGFNREVKENEVIAYTPAFGNVMPQKAGETQVIVRRNRVKAVCEKNCEIPSNGFVLSGSGSGAAFLKQLKIGDRIRFIWDIHTNDGSHFPVEDAVAGVPRLIMNGRVDVTWQAEKSSQSFVETRHPRTAVAKLNDGKFLMITVDGRSESSGGIGLYDLANLLLELGAVDAMNLDGGGSTTMYLDGKVVNHPSDKEGERKVSDALIVTVRKK
ncbi:MAG: phosphodiester glycosidase family protein [Pyrinomonadaceae bacterium]